MSNSDHPLALELGTNLTDDLQIRRVLGSGTFGITYLVWANELQCDLVVKEFCPAIWIRRINNKVVPKEGLEAQKNFEHFLNRFLEEARLAAKLKHPNVVSVQQFFRANGTGYYVMPWECGETLGERLDRIGPYTVKDALSLLDPLLDGLEHLHQAGLIHRDIKPDNIFIRESGAPLLIDLGATRLTSVAQHPVTTIYSPGYAPPEQYVEGCEFGPYSDVYAIGAVLFRMLTWTHPPDSPARAVANQHALGQSVIDALVVAKVPQALAEVIDRAMALNVDKRIQDVAALRIALATAVQPRTVLVKIADPAPAAPVLQTHKKIRPARLALVLGLPLAALIAVVGILTAETNPEAEANSVPDTRSSNLNPNPEPVPTPEPLPEVPSNLTPGEVDQPESFRSNPQFGGTQDVVVESEGVGETPQIATLWAIESAIAQVNGRRVESGVVSLRAQLIEQHASETATSNFDAFAQVALSASSGAVSSYRVLSQVEIQPVEAEMIIAARRVESQQPQDTELPSETRTTTYGRAARVYAERFWKVRIEANVARFVTPKKRGRPTLAVVMPTYQSISYKIGDSAIAAVDVAEEVRTHLVDELTQTKRFIILDRAGDQAFGSEIDFINSGRASTQEIARIGQQLAADLLLVASIDRFEYLRHTSSLRMSQRKLVSYAGGATIALRLLNFATGEVVMSESFAHELPATAPSTLARSINGRALARQMMDALGDRMTTAVVSELFPISVVALTGNTVVLSQGRSSVEVGQRYNAVVLGKELTDPQTGNSLGRIERPCCIIEIDRVSDLTSYGTMQGPSPVSESDFQPGRIELRDRAADTSDKSR